MVKYDPEFIAAKRKKTTRLPVAVADPSEDFKDQTWQDLISRHVPTTFSEDFLGMSLIQLQHGEFTSGGVTCHSRSMADCGFCSQGTPLATFP